MAIVRDVDRECGKPQQSSVGCCGDNPWTTVIPENPDCERDGFIFAEPKIVCLKLRGVGGVVPINAQPVRAYEKIKHNKETNEPMETIYALLSDNSEVVVGTAEGQYFHAGDDCDC